MALTAADQAIIDRYKNENGLSFVSVLPAGTTTSATGTTTTTGTTKGTTTGTPTGGTTGGTSSGSSLLSSVGGLGSLAVGAAGLLKGNGSSTAVPAGLQSSFNSALAGQAKANQAVTAAQNQVAAAKGPNAGDGDLEVAENNLKTAQDNVKTADAAVESFRTEILTAQAQPQKQSFLAKNSSTIEFAGGAIGGAVAGNSLFSSIQGLIDKGVTFKGVLTAAGSLLGLGVAMRVMHIGLGVGGFDTTPLLPIPIIGEPATSVLFNPNIRWGFGVGAILSFSGPWLPKFLYWLTSTEGILAVGGLIIAAAILTDLLQGKPPAEQTALEALPVWSTGKVLSIASTAAFMSAGYNIDASPMALTSLGMPVPVLALTGSIFAGQNYSTPITKADGSLFYDGKKNNGVFDDGSPIVVKGADGKNSEILEITKGNIANGVMMDNVKVINLAKGLSFTAPSGASGPSSLYIPWEVNNKVNADAVNNTTNMNDLLAACQQGILDPVSCQNALTLAASKNKSLK